MASRASMDGRQVEGLRIESKLQISSGGRTLSVAPIQR